LLASAGAIEIEPAGGEHLRTRQAGTSAALAFAPLNARKRSLQLDLKTARAGRRHAGREFRARRHGSPRAASATYRRFRLASMKPYSIGAMHTR
jgi:hypothetical protein